MRLCPATWPIAALFGVISLIGGLTPVTASATMVEKPSSFSASPLISATELPAPVPTITAPLPVVPGTENPPAEVISPEPVVEVEPDSEAPAALARGTNEFGSALLVELMKRQPRETVVLSPYGIATALTMVAEGATGETRAAFDRLLNLAALGGTTAGSGHRALKALLDRHSDDTSFKVVNGLWARDGIGLVPAFVAGIRAAFDAQIETVDFSKADTLDRINDWIAEGTAGMIPHLLAQLSPATPLVLANAVYFKSTWLKPFNPAVTETRPFAVPVGSPVPVPMMYRYDETMSYREEPTFQAVKLAYTGGEFALTVVLPAKDTDPAAVAQAFIAAEIANPLGHGNFESRVVTLGLPRLDLKYRTDLRPGLEAAGLGIAFDEKADFSRLLAPSSPINAVIHATALKLDEKGTEAAAATAVVMSRGLSTLNQKTTMIVDRPFLVLLRHTLTGTLLFLGYVTNPAG